MKELYSSYKFNTSIVRYGNFLKITKFNNYKEVFKIDNHEKICVSRIELNCNCNQKEFKIEKRNFSTKSDKNIQQMKTRFLQKALHNFSESQKITFLTLTFRNRKDKLGDKAANDIEIAFKRVKIWMKEVKRMNGNDFKYCYVWELTKKGGIHFHFLIENTLNGLVGL